MILSSPNNQINILPIYKKLIIKQLSFPRISKPKPDLSTYYIRKLKSSKVEQSEQILENDVKHEAGNDNANSNHTKKDSD